MDRRKSSYFLLFIVGFIIALVVVSLTLLSYFLFEKMMRDHAQNNISTGMNRFYEEAVRFPIYSRIEFIELIKTHPLFQQWLDGTDKEIDPALNHDILRYLSIMFSDTDYDITLVRNSDLIRLGNGTFTKYLSAINKEDSWYFEQIKSGEELVLDIDYDPKTRQTKFWLNSLVTDEEGKAAGLISIGRDTHRIIDILFLEKNASSDSEKDGQRVNWDELYFAGKDGLILLTLKQERNGEHLSRFIPEEEWAFIETNLNTLENGEPRVLNYRNAKLYYIRSLEDTERVLITIKDTSGLVDVSLFYPNIVIGFLFLLLLLPLLIRFMNNWLREFSLLTSKSNELEIMQQVIIESLTDGLVYFAKKNMEVDWSNLAAQRLFEKDKIEGICYKVLFKRNESCEECPVEKCFSTKEPQRHQGEMEDGRFFDIYAIPVFVGGEFKGVVERIRDLTPETKTNNRLREAIRDNELMLENSSAYFYLFDEDKHLIKTSKKTGKYIEENFCSDYLNRTIDEIYSGESRNLYLQIFDQTLREGILHCDYVEMIHNDGQRLYLKVDARVFDIDSQKRGVAVFTVDVTELKRLQEEVEAAAIVKSEFLANMSHEIRTPMNAVIAMNDFLLDTEMSDEQKYFATNIRNAARSLLTIINDILDFSKIESDKFEINEVPINMRHFIESIVSVIMVKVREKHLSFILDIDPNLPRQFIGDSVRIQQILINLLGNATKFTDSGYVALKIGGVTLDGERCRLVFSVKDSGSGIKEEDMQHLFGRFKQLDQGYDKRHKGTGLGLAISKKLALLMDGDIDVESRFEEGSTFRFHGIFSTKGSPDSNESHLYKDISIRICDDEESRSFMETLHKWGGNLSDFTVGEETEPCDVLIVNRNALENGTLVDSIRNIKARIILYDYYDRLIDSKPEEVPIHNTLIKPAHPVALREAIDALPGTFVSIRTSGQRVAVPDLEGKKILLVDDSPVNIDIGSRLLKRTGARFDTVEDGQMAVDAALSNGYDLILMDIHMPVMDGLTAARIILEKRPEIKIIAMTASATTGDVKETRDAGMLDHIAKPLDREDFYRRLALILGAQKKSEEPDPQEEVAESTIPPMEGIDTVAGVARIGSISDYANLLKTFFRSQAETQKTMQSHYERREFVEMGLLAHAVKGASGSIGASNLFEVSKKLEEMGKEQVEEGIEEMMADFHSQFDKVMNSLHRYLSEETSDKGKKEEAPGSLEHLKTVGEKLINAVETMDMVVAEEMVKNLQRFQWDKRITALLKKIEDNLFMFQYEKAAENIRQLLQ